MLLFIIYISKPSVRNLIIPHSSLPEIITLYSKLILAENLILLKLNKKRYLFEINSFI